MYVDEVSQRSEEREKSNNNDFQRKRNPWDILGRVDKNKSGYPSKRLES